jgi:hypothetical protein
MSIQPTGFCAGCGYPLQGLTPHNDAYRCPECGRGFDPALPKTFLRYRHGLVRRWLARPAGWGVGLVAMAAGVAIIASAWGWPRSRESYVDWELYFSPKAWADHRPGYTTRDWIYLVAAAVTVLTAAGWWLATVLRYFARRGAEPAPGRNRDFAGRRHTLVAIGLVLATAGAMFGWPFRIAQHWIARRRTLGRPTGLFNSSNPPLTLDERQKIDRTTD